MSLSLYRLASMKLHFAVSKDTRGVSASTSAAPFHCVILASVVGMLRLKHRGGPAESVRHRFRISMHYRDGQCWRTFGLTDDSIRCRRRLISRRSRSDFFHALAHCAPKSDHRTKRSGNYLPMSRLKARNNDRRSRQPSWCPRRRHEEPKKHRLEREKPRLPPRCQCDVSSFVSPHF
jgi:hypothetical protein